MSEELKKAIARGAKVETLAKKVEVEGLGGLLDQMQTLIAEQRAAHAAQTGLLIAAIDRLVDTIAEKELKSESVDLTELVSAVQNLRQDVVTQPEPTPWRVDFERDQNTRLMKTGITLTPFPKVINCWTKGVFKRWNKWGPQ